MSSTYALIGAAGFIAPRHLKAMHETGGTLVAAYDVSDSVGVLDQYFPEANFFKEFETFYAFADEMRRCGRPIDYVAICSPNYLHKPHIHVALRLGANVICEKPLVLNAADLDDLQILERDANRRIATILQLRLHPAIQALKERVSNAPPDKIFDVELSYFTARGRWYSRSWKGEPDKSGGISTNIGIHLFDMLGFVFGPLKRNTLHYRSAEASAGYLEFEHARVRWILSTNRDHLPGRTPSGQTTFRSVAIEGEEMEFSSGFTDLHTQSYKNILAGRGFGLQDAVSSIEIVEELRSASPTPEQGRQHPDLARILRA
jgi:UDP-N-acetyl-2-amino-2-deoxyglucuronate dehydrogenase